MKSTGSWSITNPRWTVWTNCNIPSSVGLVIQVVIPCTEGLWIVFDVYEEVEILSVSK